MGTASTADNASVESLAANLVVQDPSIIEFTGGRRYAIYATVIEGGTDKTVSSGTRFLQVLVTRYSDGVTQEARVDSEARIVLSMTRSDEVAELNPVESELAFAVAEAATDIATQLRQLGAQRNRAFVVHRGTGPAECAAQRCALATWTVTKGDAVICAVNLSDLQVIKTYARRSE